MKAFSATNDDLNLHGAVLLLPAVAFANIGELAVDLLVCTLQAQLVARLDDENVLACVGNNAYTLQPPGLLVTALELYQVPGTKVFLLQQRAPAIPGRQQAFAEQLATWADQEGVAHMLLLCGLDAQYRRDQQLEGTQLRFMASTSSGSTAPAEAVGQQQQQQQAQPVDPFVSSCQAAGLLSLEDAIVAAEREAHALLPPWPLLDAAAARRVAATLVTTFAAEGDNKQDAMQLAGHVLAVLQQQGLLPAALGNEAAQPASSLPDQRLMQQQPSSVITWRLPCSWRGLYGDRGFDQLLY